MVTVLCLALAGCAAPGYKLAEQHGVETLYHVDESGNQQIVYVVDKDGTLEIHDENDPIVKRIYADHRMEAGGVQKDFDPSTTENESNRLKLMAAKLIRAGRLKAAEKRLETDPIFVTVHEADMGPLMPQFTGDADQTKRRFKKAVLDELTLDPILNITPEGGDVEVFFKSYFKETAAVNVETHKLVTVTAFYFEALIRSNYLPGDDFTIRELGHWMDSREVIKRTAQRVNAVIKDKIGNSIPKDRARFLPSHSQGV